MLYDDLRNSLRSHWSRIVTPSNQSDFWNVNLPRASPFSYRFWFYSHGYTIVSVVNISHQNKQKKSHLLTKFIKHRRTRGKFILPNLKSIGKIVERFAFKIYQIAVCLYGSRQQTLSEKESFVKYQENENLQ